MAVVEPAILWTRIRPRNGLAPHIRRLHIIAIREPHKSHGNDARFNRPCFPPGTDTDFLSCDWAPIKSCQLATTSQDRGICDLALGHLYLFDRRARGRGTL